MENSTTGLASFMCILVNTPENRVDCDENKNKNSSSCVRCTTAGAFITGEALNDYSSPGHVTCLILSVFTVIVGLCGLLSSVLIIAVLRRRRVGGGNNNKSFDILLTVLAHVDLLCCFTAAASTTSMVVFWQNWNRGLVTLSVYISAGLIALFSRSASCLVTLVIAVERYLVVAYPMSTTSNNWFTPIKTRIIAGLAIVLAFFLSVIPRGTSLYIGANRFEGVESVRGLDYLIYQSDLETFWYSDAKGWFDILDFWVPLPLLLLFNGLIFYHIRKLSARRAQLNMKLKNELRASQVVLPVVAILFTCNILIIITYYFMFTQLVIYREGYVSGFLSVAINSAANLPIYFMKAPGFKEEARQVLQEWSSMLMTLTKKPDKGSHKGLTTFYVISSNPSTGSSRNTLDDDSQA